MPDLKITELTELTSVDGGDLLAIVDDPGGSPVTKKITRANLVAGIGGGGSIGSDTLANRPAAGNAGNLFLPTDGIYVYRDSGSAWIPWGPIRPFTEPINDDFSWNNQGTATVSTANGGIYMEAPTNNGDQIRSRIKSAPATPWTVDLCFLPFVLATNYTNVGFVMRESSTSKIIMFTFGYNSEFRLMVHRFTNDTIFSSTPAQLSTLRDYPQAGPVFWLRTKDDGTNLIYSYSFDGLNYRQLLSESRTAHMAGGPNQVGMCVDVNQTTGVGGAWFLHWKQS